MPVREEFLPELGILEEFAVEGDPEGAVLVGDGLTTAGQVDDREPACAEGDTWLVGIECSTCTSPAPLFLSVVEVGPPADD